MAVREIIDTGVPYEKLFEIPYNVAALVETLRASKG